MILILTPNCKKSESSVLSKDNSVSIDDLNDKVSVHLVTPQAAELTNNCKRSFGLPEDGTISSEDLCDLVSMHKDDTLSFNADNCPGIEVSIPNHRRRSLR